MQKSKKGTYTRGPRDRLGFHERKEIIELPNLIEIQSKSYNEFLQKDVNPYERENKGLQEVFTEIFPIKSYDEKTMLEFQSYHLGAPKYSPEECIRRGITYNVTLKVRFKLTDPDQVKEEEVYMGTIPYMTQNGTFIINGAERVIVSQLHRSPGISFEQERHPKGTTIYSFRIIPYRGSWLEASFDSHNHINFFIDRKKRRRKILATTFFRCLGYSTRSDIIEEFSETQRVKIKPSKDGAFPKENEHLASKFLAEDVINPDNGVVYAIAGEKISLHMLKKMAEDGIPHIRIAKDLDENNPIIPMLQKDPTDNQETALKDFYRKIRPGDPPTRLNAQGALIRLFFDPKRYNLGKVGRYKLNSKLGLPITEADLSVVTLRREDVIEAVKYLIKLKNGEKGAYVDDIDHLGNRRVRSVGELIQNQCRIALARMEKIIKERMNLFDFSSDTAMPAKFITGKALNTVLKDFFGRSQLSQFMDQTNPVSELTHKRRLSCLGPGGLSRERAGFEVRDVHPSHYGRICPIETPEGPNIGLITSLATYAKINDFGFIETPYREVESNIVTSTIRYKTADQEKGHMIAQASTALETTGGFRDKQGRGHLNGEPGEFDTDNFSLMDVSSKQPFSLVANLIPFLENDDANRALMGSNMQRQAVPLLRTEAPLVGTGLEARAAADSGAVIVAEEEGEVSFVDSSRIEVQYADNPLAKPHVYNLRKFIRSNSGTCISQTPICRIGDKILPGDILADGPATDRGEVALGKNVLVAFMPWCGYNYEDAIIISEKLIREDYYTSLYLEEFELTARDTKLGKEEITRDIPNVSEEQLKDLGEDGIIRIGATVGPGTILVGKITPKSETELSPEERLLRAIFGEKAADVKDASLHAPPGTEGVVMDVKTFQRKDRVNKSEEEYVVEKTKATDYQTKYKIREEELHKEFTENIYVLLNEDVKAPSPIFRRKHGDKLIDAGEYFTADKVDKIEVEKAQDLIMEDNDLYVELKRILHKYEMATEALQMEFKTEIEVLRKGDTELDPGIIRQVKVYVATKRKLQVGDKMAGRHGNKGVVSKLVPEADMPYLPDGQTIEIILNPLGVPSRMNMGQLLETHLGYVAKQMGIHVKTPVFEGYTEDRIWEMMRGLSKAQQDMFVDGKAYLFDGRTGERFDNRTVVGYIYMMKLSHLVADKIHARSIGPYSLVTQQPLGGKAQMGGQRFGEMEVWALEAYGAAHLLQEMLTVKSDDVAGRTRIYESIVKGENTLVAGIPESLNVLMHELQGLALDIRPEEL